MKKLLLITYVIFHSIHSFSQDSYKIEYDKPSDKFTYKKIEYTTTGDKKEQVIIGKLPKLNKGDNVIIEITNYNPFLYHVVIEDEEMLEVNGKKSNSFGFLSMFTGGLAPLSSLMTGLSGIQADFSRAEDIAKNESELELFTSESKLIAEIIQDYQKKYSFYQKILAEIEKEDLQKDVKSIIEKLKVTYKNFSDPTDKIELLSTSSRIHFFKAGVIDIDLQENANSFDYQLTKFKEFLADPSNSYSKQGIDDWIKKLESAEFTTRKSFTISNDSKSFTKGRTELDTENDVLIGMKFKLKFYRLKDILEAIEAVNSDQEDVESAEPVYLRYYYASKYWNSEGEIVDSICQNCKPVVQAEGLWKVKDDEIPRNFSELFDDEEEKKMKSNAIDKWMFYNTEGKLTYVSHGPEVKTYTKKNKMTNTKFDSEKLSSMYSVVKSVEIPVERGVIMNWASGFYSVGSFKKRMNFFTDFNDSGDSLIVYQTTLPQLKICIGSQMAFDFSGNKFFIPTLNLGAAVDLWDDREINFLIGGGLKFKKFPFISLTTGLAFTKINVLNKALQVGLSYDSSNSSLEPSVLQTKKYVPGYLVGLNINF